MANCNTQQLNITCGTDVVLHDRLIFDGETFDPNLSVGIAANLVSSLGKRTALDVQVVDDELLISVPWIDGTLPGCYGLEVTGSCNSKKWATYADSLIKYTKATRIGASEVTVESDSYDITQEVGYRYSDSPVEIAEVTVDDGYGTPSVDVEYERKKLSLAFHNLKGDPMTFDDLTPAQKEELKGEPGDSAIFDPSTGNISTMKQTTGNDDLSPMSQKAITDELIAKEMEMGTWEDCNMDNFLNINCSLGALTWYYNDSIKPKHVVMQVTPGDILLVRCTTEGAYGSLGWLSSYSKPSNKQTVPWSEKTGYETNYGTDNRCVVSKDVNNIFIVKNGVHYVVFTTVNGGSTVSSFQVWRKKSVDNLANKVVVDGKKIDKATLWIDHRNDVGNANGYIEPLTSLWQVSSKYRGRVIPFAQFKGDVVRIRQNDDGRVCRYAFLTAEPVYTDGTLVTAWCAGQPFNLIEEEYEGLVPDDCEYLYIYAYSNGNNFAPYVETVTTAGGTPQVFLPSEKLDLSDITPQLCSLGNGHKFYLESTRKQRHIAVPVTAGEIYRVRSMDGIGQMYVATSAYDEIETFANNVQIPVATGWSSRRDASEVIALIPSDGAYILLTTVQGTGMGITYEIEHGELAAPPSELPAPTPARLRIVQWNIGGFAMGKSDQSTYDDPNRGDTDDRPGGTFEHDLPIWKGTINDMDADIICCCEYNQVMKIGHDGEADVIARDTIFNCYKHAYIQPKTKRYMETAIFSKHRAITIGRKEFDSKVASSRYYESMLIRFNNKDVWVIGTHLETSKNTEPDEGDIARQAEMEELMAFAADKDYVIMCADWNVGTYSDYEKRALGAAEYDQWLEAGFKMANHGYLGDFNTSMRPYSVLDNIIVKGFEVSNIKIYDGPNAANITEPQTHQLSDHAAIGCTLTMIVD